MLPQNLLDLEESCRSDRDKGTTTSIQLVLKQSGEDGEGTLNLDMTKLAVSPDFSHIIRPHIEEITTIGIIHLQNFGDIATIIPGFPDKMDNLHTLEISMGEHETWNPLSDDRFREFTGTLRSLSLKKRVPLQPFCNINTLTKFVFSDPQFAHPLGTLSTFLEGNPSLESLDLEIGFTDSSLRVPQAPINLERLKFSRVRGEFQEDVKCLVPFVPLHKGAELIISCHKEMMRFEDILTPISHLTPSPTTILMNYEWKKMELSGLDGKLSCYNLLHPDMSSVLEGNHTISSAPEGNRPLSFADLRELHLVLPDPCRSSSPPFHFKPSMFPALKILTVEEDTRVLTAFLESARSLGSPLLDTLTIKCNKTTAPLIISTLKQFVHHNTKSLWGTPEIHTTPHPRSSEHESIVVLWSRLQPSFPLAEPSHRDSHNGKYGWWHPFT
jgi:hypothetical protein